MFWAAAAMVDKMIFEIDVDLSGSIDEDEFKSLATVLCSQVQAPLLRHQPPPLYPFCLALLASIAPAGRRRLFDWSTTGYWPSGVRGSVCICVRPDPGRAVSLGLRVRQPFPCNPAKHRDDGAPASIQTPAL